MKALAKFKLIYVDMIDVAYLIGIALSLVILFLTDWIEIKASQKI